MATYYARNVTGNWASNTSWDSASSGGAGPAGPPTASDTAVCDSGYTGSITVDTVTAVCAAFSCQTGAAGTLTISASQRLTVSGNITFVSTMTLAGTGTLRQGASGTITNAGLTHPWSLTYSSAITSTLADDLNISGTLTYNHSVTMAGDKNISCAALGAYSAGGTTPVVKFVSGQTCTVSTSLDLRGITSGAVTISSTTATSSTAIVYNGTAANCKISGVIFTDIDASGSAVNLVNWHGGTLTRTTNIYNATADSFPAIADVKNAVEYGGVDDASVNRLTGTYSASGGIMVNPGMNGGFQ